ncbi:MAG: sugar transferase [Clostridia bacterium]|nr:sugar transferase [Clostridia bacterium]
MQKHKPKGPYEACFKRLIDILFSLAFMLLFSWLYIIIALIVRFNLGAPILFIQDRPGRNGKIFKLYKFRSMSDKRDEKGELLPDKQRLNKFGRLLRSTSLDELLELFNILKGDMSLVGPRPLLVKYLEHFNSHDMRRHEVRPGLTGLAQISGRNAMSWKEKFEKDVEYVDHLTFMMDLKVVLLTIKKVFIREGIEFEEGHQPIMDYFETEGKKTE